MALGSAAGTVIAWNSATGQSLSRSFSGLDEPYLERDGRYVMVNASPTQIWDLATNTVSSIRRPGERLLGACAGAALVLRGDRCAAPATGITPLWRVDSIPRPQRHPVHDAERVLPGRHMRAGCGCSGTRNWEGT